MLETIEQEIIGQFIREGRREGMADMLAKLLEKRFGQLPDWANSKISTATPERLEAWTLQIYEATSLESLLA